MNVRRQNLGTQTTAVDQDPRWAAMRARDARAGTSFVYAVRTTGIYGRPGSASRLPRPENVEFFATAQEAEAAGYRPSRRSKADRATLVQQHAALVAQACRSISQADAPPTLLSLAQQAGLSAWHFHRVFKSYTGLTPRAYAAAHRAGTLRAGLNRSRSVTQAIYDSGYSSNSRFYGVTAHALGMTPSRYRAGGSDCDIRFAIGQSSLGAILVAQSDQGVCAILLGDDPQALVRDLQDRFARANLIGGDHDYEQQVARIVGLIEAPGRSLDLPLDLRGTAFQLRVWQALREIPPGSTATYAQVAARIGAPRAVRAVARACGANPVAVAIPCHRVVRSDGNLSGYRWGVARKRELLQREAAQATGTPSLFPTRSSP